MKFPLTLLILCFCIDLCQSQTGTAIYKKEMIYPEEMFGHLKKSDPAKYKDFKAFASEIAEAAKRVEFELRFSQGEGIFQPKEVMDTENIDVEMGIGPNGGVHYTNRYTGEKLWEMNGYGQNFLISMPHTNWTLTSEKKMIGGHQAIKATGEKIVKGSNGEVKIPIEVWFAPTLPFNYGPIGYSGLPGLIISLKMQKEHYFLSEINLQEEEFDIKRPTKGKKVTYEEFQALGRQIMSSIRPN